MKIKGEYKIELRDAKTGEITDERVGHNFVTDFWQEQWRNYGGRQPQSSYSLDGFFGGIMCFDAAIDENTDMSGNHDHPIFAPATKNMTANGCVSYSVSSGSVTELGAYNSAESIANTGRSRRYVYDWDTNEGNGTIGCVCLTSNQGGWKGVGNRTSGNSIIANNNDVGYQYTDFTYRGGTLNLNLPYNGEYTLPQVCYIKGNKVGVLYQRSDVAATSIKVREYDLPQTTRNPFNGNGSYYTYARYTEKTYTLGSCGYFDGNSYAGCGCNNGYWYVLRRRHGNLAPIDIDIINDDGTQEDYHVSIPSDQDPRTGNGIEMTGLIKKNGYIFFNTGYNYQTGSSIILWQYNIATGVFTQIWSGSAGNYGHYHRQYLIELEDVIYNDFYVIKFANGAPVVYPRNKSTFWNDITHQMGKCLKDINGDAYDIWSFSCEDTSNYHFYATGLPDIWLSTIANLQTPVQKTSDKTMKITYTLTLVEE